MRAVALVLVVLATRPADACTVEGAWPYELDPGEVGVDTSPPTQPSVVTTEIRRGTAGGCNGGTTCDDIGMIEIHLSGSADDRTAADALGYELKITAGNAPDGIARVPTAYLEHEVVFLHWIDGATDSQEEMDFTVELRLVDKAGNRSEPTELRIQDGGSFGVGCGLAGPPSRLWPLALPFLLLLRRRRQTR